MVIDFLAVFMTPVFLLFIMHPEWLPESLKFIQINDPVNVPIFLQMLILEFAIDGLKLASVNTPNMLSTPLSVVAGIILGDYTVSSGWFNAEIMLYMAFVACGKLHAGQFGTWLCAEVHADYFDLSYRCIWSVGAACRYGAGSCFDCDKPDNQRKKLYLSDCSV